MNCCDYDCTQGRHCPARSSSCGEPAAVAPFKPVARRTCLELGVCQGHQPPCKHCHHQDERTGQLDNPDAPDGEDAHFDVWDEIAYWGGHLLVGGASAFVLMVSAGFLFNRFGG